jgi:hypothetical protein
MSDCTLASDTKDMNAETRTQVVVVRQQVGGPEGLLGLLLLIT